MALIEQRLTRRVRPSSVQVAAGAVLAVGAVSALPAAYDVWIIGSILASQISGSAAGTDFLNLYSGPALLLRSPSETYSLEAQLALQRGLTGWNSPIVPFYLPPHALVLLSWLGLLPYGSAYGLWLCLSIACLVLAAHLLAPRWFGAWSSLVWLLLSLAYLPVVLGLGQGQTVAVTLLSFAGLGRLLASDKPSAWLLALAALGVSLKPQFLPVVVLALVFAREWKALLVLGGLLGALTGLAALVLGSSGLTAYWQASSAKLGEVLVSDPGFLPGPTLLHASQWFFGVNDWSFLLAMVLASCVAIGVIWVWRKGPDRGEARLLQLALLPLAALLVAPYALVYELTLWLVGFWLLWQFTDGRAGARAWLLWFVAATWLAANLGVVAPLQGGADSAALLGLALVAVVVRTYARVADPTAGALRRERAIPRDRART